MRTKPYPSEIQDRFIVRMPDGMRATLSKLSKANRRSMNAEIIARLEESLDAGNKEIEGGSFRSEEDRPLDFSEHALVMLFRKMKPEKKKALLELLK